MLEIVIPTILINVQTRQHFIDAYHAAMVEESRLWELVKGKGPGMPGYNEELWNRWMAAVSRTTESSRELREAFNPAGVQSDGASSDKS